MQNHQYYTSLCSKNCVASWSSALPGNTYWTHPISMNNREWSAISGNYPWVGYYGGASMNAAPRWDGPYVTGSTTAHILWSQSQVNTFQQALSAVKQDNSETKQLQQCQVSSLKEDAMQLKQYNGLTVHSSAALFAMTYKQARDIQDSNSSTILRYYTCLHRLLNSELAVKCSTQVIPTPTHHTL